MFSFDAIVIKKVQVKDSKNVISLISKEYWKITAWNKESKTKINLDTWNIYNFSIKTENKINKIENFKAKKIIQTSWLWYKEINNILIINSLLEKIIPLNLIIESIFDDYLKASEYLENKESNHKIYIFFTLRLLKKIWICKTPSKSNFSSNFIKLFSIIEIYNIELLMKIEWISSINLEEIEKYNSDTISWYIN